MVKPVVGGGSLPPDLAWQIPTLPRSRPSSLDYAVTDTQAVPAILVTRVCVCGITITSHTGIQLCRAWPFIALLEDFFYAEDKTGKIQNVGKSDFYYSC